MEWRLIDTAPQDGTAILAYDPAYGGWIGSIAWDDGMGWTDTARGTAYFEPTHWMPLPSAPENT